MSEAQLSALLEAIKVNSQLRQRIEHESDFNTIIAIAHDAGYDISVDDLKALATVSDDELETVSGSGCQNSICLISNIDIHIDEPHRHRHHHGHHHHHGHGHS